MSRLWNKRRRTGSVAAEEGFAVIEALVAATILALASIAIYNGYDASSRATYRAQQNQVDLGYAQQELERIRYLPYDDIALTSVPETSPDTASVLNRVRNTTFNLNRSGTANYASIVYNGGVKWQGGTGARISGGVIDPGPTRFTSGDVSGTIYRFVVWQRNHGCPQPTCSGQDVKRVIIAVQPDQTVAGGDRPYLEIHSDFINPDSHALYDVDPATGAARTTAQQFWLSDTPCDPSGPTQRRSISADHLLHNTLAKCGDLEQNGATPGAPDALLTEAPWGPPTAPYFDYQSELNAPGNTDRGIQIVPGAQRNPACSYGAGGDPTRFHVWLSDAMRGGRFDLTGNVSLSFFSKTLDPNDEFPGKICIWLFRLPPGNGAPPHFFAANATTPTLTWQSIGNTADDNWPTEWGDVNEPPVALVASADIGSQRVNPNSRLGLAISVASDVTPEALEFMYDHPLFPAVLSVDTSTPLP